MEMVQVDKTVLDTQVMHIRSNLVLNLSKFKLTDTATSLLAKGFSFSPTTTRFSQHDRNVLKKQIVELTDKLISPNFPKRKNLNFMRLPTPNFQASLQPIFSEFSPNTATTITSTTTIPSLPAPVSYSACAAIALKHRLTQIANTISPVAPDNLSRAERSELNRLHSLVKRDQLVIRKADKSRQIVLMNYSDYVDSINQILADKTNYELLPYNTQKLTAAKLINTIKHHPLPNANAKQLLLQFTKNPKPRKFYALPKTHKPRNTWQSNNLPPFRPICPDVHTETAVSAKLLSNYLYPIFVRIPSYIRNSYALQAKLMSLQNNKLLPLEAVLVVADVKNLYPSIPLNDAYNRVKLSLSQNLLPNKNISDADHQLILKLLEIHLYNNVLEFDGKFYKQLQGIPMGKAWAPAVASIYLHHWEQQVLSTLAPSQRPLCYSRYIDDIFFIARNQADAEAIILALQQADSHIKIDTFTIDKEVNFLDLKIQLKSTTTVVGSPLTTQSVSISTELYRKPTDLSVVLHAQSAHTLSLKINVLSSELIRIYRLNSDVHRAGYQMREFLYLMRKVQMVKHRVTRRAWSAFKHWLLKQANPLRPPISPGNNHVPTQQQQPQPLPPPPPPQQNQHQLVKPRSFARHRLFLPNNAFRHTVVKAVNTFTESLSEMDRLKLTPITVSNRTSKCLGMHLFKP